MEMSRQDNAYASISQAVSDLLIVGDDGGFDELVNPIEMREQGMMHHGENLFSCLVGLLGLVTDPVERQPGQPAILARVDTDDHKARDRLRAIGERAVLTI